MPVNKDAYFLLNDDLKARNAQLVAVSKTKPIEDILELYDLGHRDFGENYVQELSDKYDHLPKDIRWHFIGHLQSNKVKFIAPFVHLIHGIDSLRLLKEVNRMAKINNRTISVLLQIHIAQEETKFGLDEDQLADLLSSSELNTLENIIVEGFMGMASFTRHEEQQRKEFRNIKNLFDKFVICQTSRCKLQTLSIGMSNDYKIALEEGSTMVRIGSLIFGGRK
jgi:pyridoxal phosphate enzyme (YggS family)